MTLKHRSSSRSQTRVELPRNPDSSPSQTLSFTCLGCLACQIFPKTGPEQRKHSSAWHEIFTNKNNNKRNLTNTSYQDVGFPLTTSPLSHFCTSKSIQALSLTHLKHKTTPKSGSLFVFFSSKAGLDITNVSSVALKFLVVLFSEQSWSSQTLN